MGKMKSNSVFLSELALVTTTILLLEEYKGVHTKILCRCLSCGYEWLAEPDSLLHGHGCPNCVGHVAMTTQDFISKMQIVSPTLVVLGEYKNAHTKIHMKCSVCGYEFDSRPSQLLDGSQCFNCQHNRLTKIRTKSHEQFLLELSSINSTVEVCETYVNNYTPIECECKVCGHVWRTSPKVLLRGGGCPACDRKPVDRRITSKKRKRTTESFVEELFAINKDIVIKGEYESAHTSVECECKVCGYVWQTAPHGLLRGTGCPKCAGRPSKTTESFIEELAGVNNDIVVRGEYKSTHTPIECECRVCGGRWLGRPVHLLHGHGCPYCAGKKVLVGFNDLCTVNPLLASELVNIDDGKTVTIGSKKKLRWKCGFGHVWLASVHSRVGGNGCPICNQSHGETYVKTVLNICDVYYVQQWFHDKCKHVNVLPFDFAVFANERDEFPIVCIEYQGRQHYQPVDYFGGKQALKSQQKRDAIKREFCDEHNIPLILIPYSFNTKEMVRDMLVTCFDDLGIKYQNKAVQPL